MRVWPTSSGLADVIGPARRLLRHGGSYRGCRDGWCHPSSLGRADADRRDRSGRRRGMPV
jgi:hypothetical protein